MNYTIYKITNLINGKFYIGKHQTKNINDSYFGSGKAIKNAIEKYGKENFKKEILFNFSSEKEMNQKEQELIDEALVSREDTYNLGIGGEGGPHFSGRKHSQATKNKLIKAGRNRTVSDETKNKISSSLKDFRQKQPDFFKKNNNPNYKSYWGYNPDTGESKMFKNNIELPEGWLKGRKMNLTEKQKQHWSEVRKGISKSESHKNKISQSKKAK